MLTKVLAWIGGVWIVLFLLSLIVRFIGRGMGYHV